MVTTSAFLDSQDIFWVLTVILNYIRSVCTADTIVNSRA